MYAIAIIRYRKPLDEVLKVQDEHREYLRKLHAQGVLLVSGPCDPRYGGMLLLKVPDGNPDMSLDRIRDGDPFVRERVAQYETFKWEPVLGLEALDSLG